MVLPGHALAHRADEEDRQDATLASRADPQLLPCQEAVLQRRSRGSQQQGQTYHAKILRLPHLPCHGNRAVPRTWQTTGTSRHPQILLTRQKIYSVKLRVNSVQLRVNNLGAAARSG